MQAARKADLEPVKNNVIRLPVEYMPPDKPKSTLLREIISLVVFLAAAGLLSLTAYSLITL